MKKSIISYAIIECKQCEGHGGFLIEGDPLVKTCNVCNGDGRIELVRHYEGDATVVMRLEDYTLGHDFHANKIFS